MTHLRWIGGLVSAAILGLSGALPAVRAQENKEIRLEFKAFNADAKPFYQELTTQTVQKMKVMDQEVTQNQEQTFFIEWVPQKGEGKDLVVEQKISGVQMKIDIGGNTIEYDSTDDKQPDNPMTHFFNALKSLKLTFVIDPAKMAVKEIRQREEFVKRLSETNPQIKPLLNDVLSDSALKQMAQPTWDAIPKQVVRKGDTWKNSTEHKFGAIGTYNTESEYIYEGEENGKDKIGVKSTLKYSAPDAGDALPFKILKEGSRLASTSGAGTVYFDRDKGRIESSNMKMELEGVLVIEVGGMKTTVNLTQSQHSKYTTSDSNSIEKAIKKSRFRL